jgi:hypothetical protein
MGDHWNVYVLCASFFCLCAGDNTPQVLAPKLLGWVATASTAAFYLTACFSGGLPAPIADRVGLRMALVSCGFGYVLYVASLIYLIIPLTFFFSVLMG